MILVVLAVLVADAMAFVPGARAGTVTTFNTTALFDTGTKANVSTASDTCENVTANAIKLNNTGNYQGIGLTTGTSTCATGAWGVNSNKLRVSYDMQTSQSNNLLKDFSPSGFDGTPQNLPGNATGDFGRSKNMSRSGARFAVTGTSNINYTGAFSLFSWARINNASTYSMIAMDAPTPGCVNPTFSGLFEFYINPSRALLYQWQNTNSCSTEVSVTYGTVPLNSWVFLGFVHYVNQTVVLFIGAAHSGWLSTPGNVYSGQLLTIGARRSDNLRSVTFLDEFGFFNRSLSVAEMTEIETDGRSSLLASGSWSSPMQSGPAPIEVDLIMAGTTAANRPSRLQILSSSGVVVFDKTLLYSAGSSLISIPVNVSYSPSSWTVKLFMIGNGSASALVTSIALTAGFPATFDANAMIFLAFLILMFGLGLGGFALDFPVLTIIGGISGFIFGWWLFLQTNNVPLAILMWGVGSVFMLTGAVMALTFAPEG